LGSSYSRAVALGDVDGDGDLDAFVANSHDAYGQGNKVWLNDGTGIFSDSGQSLGDSYSRDVALGDVDGDGDLDAFVGNSNSQPNKVWLNQPITTTLIVTSTADSGPGTLRQALLDAGNGDTITFDPAVFPPGSPATIALTSGQLPDLDDGNVTIDASDAGVILDASGIGTTPETVLLDDVSLTLDGGPNLITNGDFSAGLGHWRPWDERPGATRGLNSSDFTSSPNSYEWSSVAHAGDSRTVYDTTDTSAPFDDWPYDEGSTVWMAATGDSTAEVHFWYRYGGVEARLRALFPDGHEEWIGDWWFNWEPDWAEAVVSHELPGDAIGVALELRYRHSERWSSGLWINSNGNTIRGLQIVNFPDSGIGLDGGAQNNTIGGDRGVGTGLLGQGNLISGNGGSGVSISGSGTMSNTVSGNYIGTDVSGMIALGNYLDGVSIGGQYNRVGGTTPDERNLISGNGDDGIELSGANHLVVGNYIGTNISGTAAISNGYEGIRIQDAHSCTIQDNLLSGNVSNGIEINPGHDNLVIGNLIGTDATGTASVPNQDGGIIIVDGSYNNIIGGDTAAYRNIISGNEGDGVHIYDHEPSDGDTISNTISGNYIGTDVSGMTVLGNGNAGVYIGNGAQYNVIGGNNATPGGNCTGECNVISGNGWDGVAIRNSGTMSNTISGNYIGTDVSGTADLGNGAHGILIQSGAQQNIIGGTTAGAGNLISGNDRMGVLISDEGTDHNTVSGNFIGTNVIGTVAISNTWSGVYIDDGAQYNVIGGDTERERNVISGNGDRGIVIEGTGTMSNTVSGDYIGTDVSGTTGLGNAWMGVDIREGAQANIIGGGTAGERNIISSNGFVGVGIRDADTDNNVVIGNFIGTNVSGTAELGSTDDGVRLEYGSEHNIVGGATAGERNIISGNGRDGVDIGGAHNNLIIGNYIGTDVSGTAALGNAERGIGINNAGQGLATTLNVIERNLISGNGCNGIDLYGMDTVSNTVRGNLIGTDAAGTSALENGCQGIWFGGGAHHNTVGGSTPQDRNVISGNNWGVGIEGAETTNNTVTGNFIGLDISGTAALGNNNAGVVFYGGSQRNIIGPDNTIAYNGTNGVVIYGSACLRNTITHNSIYSNTGLGIDLRSGANDNIVAPVVISFNTTTGDASGTACAGCTIEVFSDNDDEGRWYEGTTTADGAGNWSFNKGSAFTGANVHATATNADGNTSEFGRKPMTLYVDASNDTGWEDGSAMHPFNTLEEAMEVDADGDTVLVAQGTYIENITIDREITLEGGYASYTSPDSWTRDMALYETIIDGSANQTVLGDWDGEHIGSPVIISTGATLEMWYDGRDLTGSAQLGRATSSDEVNWTKDAGNPLFGSGASGAWDEGSVWEPFVLLDGGTYEMWYTADGDAIGYATSTDGITWTRHPDPVLEGGPEGTWDEDGVSDPYVIKAGGTYTIWYESWTDTRRIGCATSTDGINWTKCAANPVFEPGDPGDWDETAVHDPVVVLRDGTYHMWYRGTDPDWTWHVGYVTSPDGINWTRFLTGPVLSATDGEWDEGSVGLGDVFFDGATYHMWYGANSQIGYAWSSDGISWTKSVSNPVLTPGTPGHWGQPVVRFEDGSDGSVLDGFTITGGDAQRAGGVDATNASITIRKCLIHDNFADGSPDSSAGAGVLGGWPGTTLTIVDSRIVGNQVNQGAGGVRVYDGTLVMTNTLVADNHGEDGLHLNGPATLMNVTVSDNDGGILFNPQFSATLRITNSIIYNNGHSLWSSDAGTVQVAYSDVEGGWPGTGNIDADPRFVDPASGDYHLQPGSPCIDAGTSAGAPDHDFEGDPRPMGAGVDMGADEYYYSATISEVRVTNVRDTSFTVSWITDIPSDGHANYGTDPATLDQIAYDARGTGARDDTHYVTIADLSPSTTYYFDVVSGSTTDDNGGAHYVVITGPTLGLPTVDTIYGQVFKEDETTPAEGTIVYITLRDKDGNGSSGEAALLSALVDGDGWWSTNLGNA
ncbi:MAG: right-handed parallel beta-helix repeat-containing protein, partial [Chloroflexi bacterium]|nr:right-handed parallel beta-helix repeat-containing protein [Chloroflexota bacterium]